MEPITRGVTPAQPTAPRRSTRRRLLAAVLAAPLLLGAAACGDDDGGSADPDKKVAPGHSSNMAIFGQKDD